MAGERTGGRLCDAPWSIKSTSQHCIFVPCALSQVSSLPSSASRDKGDVSKTVSRGLCRSASFNQKRCHPNGMVSIHHVGGRVDFAILSTFSLVPARPFFRDFWNGCMLKPPRPAPAAVFMTRRRRDNRGRTERKWTNLCQRSEGRFLIW